MKAKITLIAIILAFIVTNGLAQEKSKKQSKEEKKIEKQSQTEAMINSRQFVFIGRTALPTGYKTVNLTTIANYVRFYPDSIESYMPFYGRAFSGVGYSNDDGLKFSGKPQEYTVTKGKKNYQVNAVVKSEKDTFRLSLTVSFTGTASLNITSNNRSSISYSGEISVPEKQKDQK